MKENITKNCLNCSHLYLKQDIFWDYEDCCICEATNKYLGYPEDIEKEHCEKWQELKEEK